MDLLLAGGLVALISLVVARAARSRWTRGPRPAGAAQSIAPAPSQPPSPPERDPASPAADLESEPANGPTPDIPQLPHIRLSPAAAQPRRVPAERRQRRPGRRDRSPPTGSPANKDAEADRSARRRTQRLAREQGSLGRAAHAAVVIALLALVAALAAIIVPRLLGYGALIVTGGSMGRAAPSGSVVIGRRIDAQDVKVDQVILVKEPAESGPAQPKLHRIVSLERDGGQFLVRTKGDENEAADPKLYVLPDQVLTPVYKLPYLGYFLAFVLTPIGWAVVVALPSLVLCVSTLRSIWSNDDKAPALEPPAIDALVEDRRRRAA